MLEKRIVSYFINKKVLIKKLILLCSLLWITPAYLEAQVIVKTPSSIDNLMMQFEQMNTAKDKMSGYRLQIIASDDRRKVDNVRSKVSQSHPEYRVIWKFSNPYYKVLAGAFRTKLEAERARYLVGQTYNNVLIVLDNEIPRTELAP